MRTYLISLGMLLGTMLQAEIRKINQIDEVFVEVRPDSILLMDLDETLIESSIMLGSKAWRNYAVNCLKTVYSREKVQDLSSKITHWIAQRVPCVAVENNTPVHLNRLKEKQIPVFGFTARGRNHWNMIPCPEGEDLALLHLKQAGFDLEACAKYFSSSFLSHHSFAKGIFFARYPLDNKGKLALEIFAQARLSHVLFVDDDMNNVFLMDNAFTELGIPAICFYYPHVELYRSFDPIIAAIQLEKLYLDNLLLSDADATLLKHHYAHRNPDIMFLETLEHLIRAL